MALSFYKADKKSSRDRAVFYNTLHAPNRSRHLALEPHDLHCPEWKGERKMFKGDAEVSRPSGTSRDPWSKQEWCHYHSTYESNGTLDKWRNKRATLNEFMKRDDRATETATTSVINGGSVGDYEEIMNDKIDAYDNRHYQEDYGEYMYDKFIWNNPLNKDYNYSGTSPGPNRGQIISKSRLANPQGNLNYKSTAHHYNIRHADKMRMRARLHNRYTDFDRDEAFQATEFTENPRKRYSGRPRTTKESRRALLV